jgi:hypothetical protein
MNNASPKQKHQFTNTWFSSVAKPIWDQLIPKIAPSRILEIGAYEGASTCYLIDSLSKEKGIEIHCVDTWEGGVEHKQRIDHVTEMSLVEQRFHHNTSLSLALATHPSNLVCHKGLSDIQLAKLLADGKGSYFDFIYVDGSHEAPDVLLDAILSFKLLRLGGFLAFDDYLWAEPLPYGTDPIRCPKPAIDAFTNLFCRKIQIISAPLYQIYMQKTAE